MGRPRPSGGTCLPAVAGALPLQSQAGSWCPGGISLFEAPALRAEGWSASLRAVWGWAQLPRLQALSGKWNLSRRTEVKYYIALSPPRSPAHCQSSTDGWVPWWPAQGTVVAGSGPCKGLAWPAGQRGRSCYKCLPSG